MKKIFLLIGCLTVLATCTFAQKVVDKTVPADQSAILYYHKDIKVSKVDDKKLGLLGLMPVKGKGSVKNPKARLQIPAGQHRITAEYVNYGWQETSYEFLAGRRYQIEIKIAGKGESTGAKLGNAVLGQFKYEWVITDITDKVKK